MMISLIGESAVSKQFCLLFNCVTSLLLFNTNKLHYFACVVFCLLVHPVVFIVKISAV